MSQTEECAAGEYLTLEGATAFRALLGSNLTIFCTPDNPISFPFSQEPGISSGFFWPQYIQALVMVRNLSVPYFVSLTPGEGWGAGRGRSVFLGTRSSN